MKRIPRVMERTGAITWCSVVVAIVTMLLIVMTPSTVTAQMIPMGNNSWTYFATRIYKTTSADVMSTPHLETEKSVSFPPLDLTKDDPVHPAQIHRLGILPSLSNDHTMTILKMFEDRNNVFEVFNISDSSSGHLSSYNAAVWEIRSQNLTAVIGSFHPEYSVACEYLRIPYLVTSQTPSDQESNISVIKLFPGRHVFSSAVLDMLDYYRFRKVALFYDSPAGAATLALLLGQSTLTVTAFQVQQRNISQVRHALKAMRDKYFVNFITVLSADVTGDVMNQALSLSMFSSPFKWILVNTGLQEFSLEEYVDSRANVTVLRLMMDYTSSSCALSPDMINLRSAIFHDALKVYMMYAKERADMADFSMGFADTQVHGCTGDLNFTSSGHRTENFLQVMTLQGYRTGKVTDEEFVMILDLRKKKAEEEEKQLEEPQLWCQRLSGTWRSNEDKLNKRLIPSRSYSRVARMGQNVFGDRPLRVTTLLEPPFVQLREDNSSFRENGIMLSDGRELEGMCVDILKELALLLDFRFNVSFVPDGKFGSLKPWGWTGMVRQLKDDKADVAMAPFQMSESRSVVVDFTKPFMTKGTTVVVRRPEQRLWIFQFLLPLSRAVWSAIFLAFVLVSLTLFGVSRVNSDRRAKYTSNLRESFWYIWGTLLRGSLNGSPHAISSRIVSSAWWFFCLIVTSIYTANLAAFLTITIGDAGINSASDLANQDQYDYGTVEGSQTETFFNHTGMTDYAKMWAYMSINQGSIVRRVEHGFERVRKGGYAFIWDSPTIRYQIYNDCSLMEVGTPFDSKGYGFAIQKHAPYGEKLSWALLKLNDAGILYRLERKWFRPQYCPGHRQSATTDSLNLHQVAGMYLVLLAGIIMSVTLCLLQYFIAKYRDRHKKTREEDTDASRSEEPCLKANMDASNSNSETIQVYANHSPYGYRSYSQNQW